MVRGQGRTHEKGITTGSMVKGTQQVQMQGKNNKQRRVEGYKQRFPTATTTQKSAKWCTNAGKMQEIR